VVGGGGGEGGSVVGTVCCVWVLRVRVLCGLGWGWLESGGAPKGGVGWGGCARSLPFSAPALTRLSRRKPPPPYSLANLFSPALAGERTGGRGGGGGGVISTQTWTRRKEAARREPPFKLTKTVVEMWHWKRPIKLQT